MDIEKIEKQAELFRIFIEDYAECVLWSRAPDGDVKASDLLKWIIANRHLIAICDDIEKLNT